MAARMEPEQRFRERVRLVRLSLSSISLHLHKHIHQHKNRYGKFDTRYRLERPTEYGSNIDKVVLAVEVPAGIFDGILCVFWLNAILYQKWYRYPVQLVVSALHAFGTVVFWADEFFYGYMAWYKGMGWKTPHCDPSDIGFYWAFIGTNFVWILVPGLCMYSATWNLKRLITNSNIASNGQKIDKKLR